MMASGKDKVCAAALVLALGLGAEPAGAQEGTLLVGGQERRYLLHVPPATDRGLRLLVVLHGGGGTPGRMAEHTAFNRLADSSGMAVVYPAAIDGLWRDGRGGETDRADLDFLSRLLDTLGTRRNLDVSRVYLTGISNGGSMAYRAACEFPERIAAIAVVAAPLLTTVAWHCPDGKPVSVLVIHGTADRLAPFTGGRRALPVERAAAFWATRAGCAAPGEPRRIDRIRDGTVVWHTVFPSCRAADVELYAIQGGGHTWPGGPPVRAPRLGRTSAELDATRAILGFFTRHQR